MLLDLILLHHHFVTSISFSKYHIGSKERITVLCQYDAHAQSLSHASDSTYIPSLVPRPVGSLAGIFYHVHISSSAHQRQSAVPHLSCLARLGC